MKRFLMMTALALVALPALAADDPFAKKPADWTLEDVKAVLNKENAWVKTSEVFSRDLLATEEKSQKTVSNDRESAFIRWYSAGIIRQAVVRAAKLAGGLADQQAAEMTKPIDRFYVIEVSASKLTVADAIGFDEMEKNVTLESDDGSKFALVNVVRPKQTGAPEILFFFDRGKGIPESAKKATFRWQLGDTKIEGPFDLAKMVVDGKRDLDGDTAPLTAEEKRRRAIQAAALTDADLLLKRAVEDLSVEKSPSPARPWKIVIFYNANRAADQGTDLVALALTHKEQLARDVGKWSSANKDSVYALVFADRSAGKVTDFVTGQDAEALAKKQGEAARKFFESKLQKVKEKS